jgi:integrase
MRKPIGHIRPHGAGYEVAVPVGRDPITKRYSYSYASAPTFEEAEAVRDKMLADLAKGRQPRDDATVESGAAEVP